MDSHRPGQGLTAPVSAGLSVSPVSAGGTQELPGQNPLAPFSELHRGFMTDLSSRLCLGNVSSIINVTVVLVIVSVVSHLKPFTLLIIVAVPGL